LDEKAFNVLYGWAVLIDCPLCAIAKSDSEAFNTSYTIGPPHVKYRNYYGYKRIWLCNDCFEAYQEIADAAI